MRLPGSKSILRANRRWAAVRAKSTLSEILAIQIKHSIAELSARDDVGGPDGIGSSRCRAGVAGASTAEPERKFSKVFEDAVTCVE